MSDRLRLFKYRHIYDHPGSEDLFVAAMAETLEHHEAHCPDYAKLLRQEGCAVGALDMDGVMSIPPIPTLFLKRHGLHSMPVEKMIWRSTTSGTSGTPVTVGLDRACIRLGASMLWRMVRRHGLLSPRPTRHIILGYQPSKHNQMGAVRTAFNSTWLAPPISRVYALRDTGESYDLDMDGVRAALIRYENGLAPVRLCGFPAYMLFLLKQMQREGLSLLMPPHSKVLLGGGWKQFMAERVDKRELYAMVEQQLGISEDNIVEFFGVVEHMIPYFDCEKHHFHVPIYSRVVVRDPHTLKPLPDGQPGLLNLLTPFLHSMPLLSIMTDDIAILHPGASCGCGIDAPWFEILGRAGADFKTCAAKAEELI